MLSAAPVVNLILVEWMGCSSVLQSELRSVSAVGAGLCLLDKEWNR